MIALPNGARILPATKPVDFRKGAHSLAVQAAEVLDADPFSGAVLVFRPRRPDQDPGLGWRWPGAGLEAARGRRVPLARDRGRRATPDAARGPRRTNASHPIQAPPFLSGWALIPNSVSRFRVNPRPASATTSSANDGGAGTAAAPDGGARVAV